LFAILSRMIVTPLNIGLLLPLLLMILNVHIVFKLLLKLIGKK